MKIREHGFNQGTDSMESGKLDRFEVRLGLSSELYTLFKDFEIDTDPEQAQKRLDNFEQRLLSQCSIEDVEKVQTALLIADQTNKARIDALAYFDQGLMDAKRSAEVVLGMKDILCSSDGNWKVVERKEYDEQLERLEVLMSDYDIAFLTNMLCVIRRAKERIGKIKEMTRDDILDSVRSALKSNSKFSGHYTTVKTLSSDSIVLVKRYADGIGVVLEEGAYRKWVGRGSMGASDGVGGVFIYVKEGSKMDAEAIMRHERGHQILQMLHQ